MRAKCLLHDIALNKNKNKKNKIKKYALVR